VVVGKAGEFAGAEKEFRAVLKHRPQDAGAHFNLGLALIGNPAEKLDWSGAMAEFRAALAAKPGYHEARRMLSECLLNTGDPAAAVGELEALLKTRPSYVQARFSLACALEAASDTDGAIGELRRVVQEKPDFAEAHATLGKLLGRIGQKQAAVAELEKALRLNPDLAASHLTLAAILRQDGDGRAGIELAQGQRLARRNSDAIQAVRLSNKGLDAAASGNLASAIALLRQSVGTRPDYALAHYNLGLLLAASGDFRGAASELRTSASLGPTLAKPWYSLGRVLEKSGDPDSALGSLERAAQLEPEDGRADSLARELRTKGAKSKPPQLTPDTAQGHNEAGAERSRAGDWLGAIGEFLRALEMQRGFADARYNLAIAMYQGNQRDGAELELRKVLLLRSDAATHYALGVILKDKGDPGARFEFEMALKLDPASGVARHELELMQPGPLR
jgi:tetratricopeptide (TPR) repeat protein